MHTSEVAVFLNGTDAVITSPVQVVLTVTKPGEKGDVPVGVIAGSVVAGLLLLAIAVGLLWKVRITCLCPKTSLQLRLYKCSEELTNLPGRKRTMCSVCMWVYRDGNTGICL